MATQSEWERRGDLDVRAAHKHLEDYNEDEQVIIKSEMERRQLKAFPPARKAKKAEGSGSGIDTRFVVLGCILLVLSALLFVARGDFAQVLFGAKTLGNVAWDRGDAAAIRNVVVIAGLVALGGGTLVGVGLFRRRP